MAFNGSGTFSLYSPGNPVVTGTTISSTWANNTLTDIANNGLTFCVTKNGQTTTTTSIPFVQGIGVGAANAFAVSAAGNVTSTGTGGAVIKGPIDITAATAGQIQFPATQNPSTNANTLDDYEEGTFTPTANSLTVVGSPTYSGTYEKIGKLVQWDLKVESSVTTASTANTTSFSGMPFAADSTSTCTACDSSINSLGVGLMLTGGSTMYPPTWSARQIVYLSGTYRATA